MVIQIGLVIPVWQTRFISQILARTLQSCKRKDLVICVVNDGVEEVARFLSTITLPPNVITLNLPENRCFAAANNAGWHYLVEHFPSVRYLGSLNDDTIPRNGWLDSMLFTIEHNLHAAVTMPIMQTNHGIWGIRKNYATWLLKDAESPMVPNKHRIYEDTFVPVINGFCFLARRNALEEVNFFDERYRNSCEDVDLSLKLLSNGWRIIVCHNAYVFHYGGKSRHLNDISTDIVYSHRLLAEKWGVDLTSFNKCGKL
jgi:GT2 family glycosyltransferase